MSDYTQNVFFGPKDALSTGDPDKIARGTEIDAELDEISTAIASKEDTANKGQALGYAGLDAGGLVAAADLPDATESAEGIVELATTAEVVTGTDTARAVTPAGVEAWAAQNGGMVQDIANLADPGADTILGWDESANAAIGYTMGAGILHAATEISVDHDAATNFVANEHIDHSGVSITAGDGLTGGGTIAATRDIAVGAGTGITVNANDVAVDRASTTSTTAVGYLDIPQNAQTGNYTLVIGDRGKHIYKASGGSGETITIPANASVAFPIGTVVVVINQGGGTLTIAITSDTLTQAETGDTGARVLADDGIATLIKVTSTAWMISGVGIT